MSDQKHTGRWAAIYEAMTGATAPGHHHDDQPIGTDGASIKAGHEPDHFDARGLLMVPVLVVVVTGVAYVLVSSLFSFFSPGSKTPGTNPAAVAENEKSYNDRIGRISSSDPNAEVKQPRLEYIRSVDNQRDGVSKPDPVYLRSFAPSATNNTYELTPQDLYPSRFVDPATGKRLLAEPEWITKDKTVARIPVEDAIKLLAGKLPHAKEGKAVASVNGKPSLANGGQSITPAVAPAPAKDDHKH